MQLTAHIFWVFLWFAEDVDEVFVGSLLSPSSARLERTQNFIAIFGVPFLIQCSLFFLFSSSIVIVRISSFAPWFSSIVGRKWTLKRKACSAKAKAKHFELISLPRPFLFYTLTTISRAGDFISHFLMSSESLFSLALFQFCFFSEFSVLFFMYPAQQRYRSETQKIIFSFSEIILQSFKRAWVHGRRKQFFLFLISRLLVLVHMTRCLLYFNTTLSRVEMMMSFVRHSRVARWGGGTWNVNEKSKIPL